MENWKNKYKEYYNKWTDDIISTKELINKAIMLNPWIESEIIKSLIEVKAIRAQTKAIEKNSKSADFLAKVWIFIWVVWAIATIIWTIYWVLSYLKID